MDHDTTRLNGGALLAKTLIAAGVEKIFALHGGHLDAFFHECLAEGLELVDFRHEAAAGHAAEGYARATGKLGVCCITAGPGFSNAITPILSATLDSTPTLFIIGAPPLRERETNELQGGFDQIALATPAAKWAVRVLTTERMPDITAMAIRKAMTGKRGAVVLEVPIDVLHMECEARHATLPTGMQVRPRPAPSASETVALRDMLVNAKRPVFIAGADARFSDCGDALRTFAEASGIPVMASKRGLGILPSAHPLNGHEGSLLGRLKQDGQRPDLVVLLGARLGFMLGGRGGGILPTEAALIQIHSDAGEIGRIRDVSLAIAADCRSTLESLGALPTDWPDRSEWAARVTGLQLAADAEYPIKQSERGIHPYHAAKEVARLAGHGAAFAFDGGETGAWGAQVARVDGPGRVMTTGYLGCLGVSQGFAIGAKVAHPQRVVVQMAGDGAVGFNIQEIETMVRHRLNVIMVVLNNGIWGVSLHGQQIMFGQNYSAISKLGQANYAEIARGFGCQSDRIIRFEDIEPAMRRALASDMPVMLEIMTDPEVVHPSTVNMLGEVAEGSGDLLIPYYENIPHRR